MSAEIIAFRKREKPKDKIPSAPPSRRLEALDALRGLCVIGMVLLAAFPQATGRDAMLAPMLSAGFLVCLGMAIPLSLAGRAARQSRGRLMLHIGLRTVVLVVLGVVISNAPDFNPEHLILTGPLQFAGLCYGLAATACLSLGRKSDADFSLSTWPAVVVGAGALGIYVGYMLAAPVPVLPAYYGFEPLTVLGGLGTVMLGVLAALYIRKQGIRNTLAGLGFLGILLLIVGGSLAKVLPVDGELWSPTFVLVAGGAALVVLALAAIATEIPGAKIAAYPLRVFGGNALVAFIAVALIDRLSPMLGSTIPDPHRTPELYAGALLLIIGLPLWGLYRKRIFLTP